MTADPRENLIEEASCSPVFSNVWICGIIAVALSSFYVAANLQTGWFPYDDGQLGHAAERVLEGEMPHRDFDEMYTGALTYLNALSFKIFGVRSESMRWMLWLFFIPFVATIYWIAARACPPWAAGLIAFFCATITIPVYSAAMPSWYNLFFMTWGVGCLFKFIETDNRLWILGAGLCAGISILFKITGIYWLSAAILFLVYHEQNKKSEHHERSIGFDVFVLSCLGAFGLLALNFSKKEDWILSSIHLTLPLILIAVFIAFRQLQTHKGRFAFRLTRLLKLQIPLIASAVIPVACLIGFYAAQSSLAELYEGLVVLPAQRIGSAQLAFPNIIKFSFAIPLAAILAAGFFKAPPSIKRNKWVIAAAFTIASIPLALCWNHILGFQVTFHSMRNIGPFVIAIALCGLLSKQSNSNSSTQKQQLFLLTVAAAMACSVQFPFAGEIYFLYAAPMIVLCIAFVSRNQGPAVRLVHCGVMGVFLFFAVFHMASPIADANIYGTRKAFETDSVNLQKCSLEIEASTANIYRQVVHEITSRSAPGEYIFAGPDFPEAYFLADRKNPTRIFYDFFRPDFQKHPERLIEQLDHYGVNVVVIKKFKIFSELSPEFETAIRQHYPHHKTIKSYHRTPGDDNGIAFVIYWRD